ncbi:MAG: hypothetical protein NTY68_02225, partial [Candidatus Micrarchaeota archaeon]|nr:hypothetical protein [Candidatus Micrarchaeota archaeon]
VYAKEGGRIFVLEYNLKLKMRDENRPIRVIISNSEGCDADALHLYKEQIRHRNYRVFVSLKGVIKNQI